MKWRAKGKYNFWDCAQIFLFCIILKVCLFAAPERDICSISNMGPLCSYRFSLLFHQGRWWLSYTVLISSLQANSSSSYTLNVAFYHPSSSLLSATQCTAACTSEPNSHQRHIYILHIDTITPITIHFNPPSFITQVHMTKPVQGPNLCKEPEKGAQEMGGDILLFRWLPFAAHPISGYPISGTKGV